MRGLRMSNRAGCGTGERLLSVAVDPYPAGNDDRPNEAFAGDGSHSQGWRHGRDGV